MILVLGLYFFRGCLRSCKFMIEKRLNTWNLGVFFGDNLLNIFLNSKFFSLDNIIFGWRWIVVF